MLSRVADALFWTSRYLERAEHVTRLLDVWFHLELDLAKVGPAARERHWRSLAAILQQQLPAAEDGATREPIVRWRSGWPEPRSRCGSTRPSACPPGGSGGGRDGEVKRAAYQYSVIAIPATVIR